MAIARARPLEPGGHPADEELVEEVLGGRPARFEPLVTRHRARVRRAVRAVLRDQDEVEDVVQQAFVQAFTALGGFSGAATFAAWLTRIAVNEALLRSRRCRRADHAAMALAASSEDPVRTPEQEAERREWLRLLEDALLTLPASRRELLLLVIGGESHADIACRLGIRESAAKLRVHRARQALRSALRTERRATGVRGTSAGVRGTSAAARG